MYITRRTHHDTNGLAGIQGGVSLGNLIIQTRFTDHGDEDVIGSSGDIDTLRGDFAQDTDGDARAGEGVSHDEFVGDAEFATKGSDFVFEELAEGLDELHSLAVDHAFWDIS